MFDTRPPWLPGQDGQISFLRMGPIEPLTEYYSCMAHAVAPDQPCR